VPPSIATVGQVCRLASRGHPRRRRPLGRIDAGGPAVAVVIHQSGYGKPGQVR